MKLRVGDIDVVYSYEQRGKQWVLYRHIEGEAPGASQQHYYETVIECHDAWMAQCVEAIGGAGELFAPQSDLGTQRRISVLLEDA